MQGNPPSTTYTQLLRNWISLASSLTITIYHFSRVSRTTEQGESFTYPMSAPRYPTFPPHIHCSPPHIKFIPHQSKLHAKLRHFVPPRATGGMFSLSFDKYFLRSLTLFFFRYCCNLYWSSHLLESVTLQIYYLEYCGGRLGASHGGKGGEKRDADGQRGRWRWRWG